MSYSTGSTGLLAATSHGFMEFRSMSPEIVMQFILLLTRHKSPAEDVITMANECTRALQALGRDDLSHKNGLEIAASAIEMAAKSHPNAPEESANKVLETCVKLYTQESNGVNFVYKEVNRLLRNVESFEGNMMMLRKAVQSACGRLNTYVFLLWEGLKQFYPAKPVSQSRLMRPLYRGMRLPLTAYRALCLQVGRYIVMPGFTSFSLEHDVALRFPVNVPPADPQREVDIILKLDSYSRPWIERVSAFKTEHEVVMYPFSVFKVQSFEEARPDCRAVVQLIDIEIMGCGPPVAPSVELVIAIEGMPAKRKRRVPADQRVGQLVAMMNVELKRTDLCELWDGECVIDSDQVVADYVRAGVVFTRDRKSVV